MSEDRRLSGFDAGTKSPRKISVRPRLADVRSPGPSLHFDRQGLRSAFSPEAEIDPVPLNTNLVR